MAVGSECTLHVCIELIVNHTLPGIESEYNCVTLLCVLLQIDSSNPSSNSTVVDSLVQNGTLAIQVDASDTGSGINKVDVYQLNGML